jgi:homoaconitase/3-isopropylmalate dehydratase large subunit
LKFYEQAGFEIGAPGCSYCIAVAADHAGEGEIWLSSQNRNFRNRMVYMYFKT